MILYANDDDVFLLSIVLLCFARSSALCARACVRCFCVQASSETFNNALAKNRADVTFLAARSFWRRCFAVSSATLARTASETRTL